MLSAHADTLADQLTGTTAQFTPNKDADRLIRDDPFAFLLGVVSDMGIRAERAWALPYHLRQRLGSLTPAELAAKPCKREGCRSAGAQAARFVT